jgi:hypothetical protein
MTVGSIPMGDVVKNGIVKILVDDEVRRGLQRRSKSLLFSFSLSLSLSLLVFFIFLSILDGQSLSSLISVINSPVRLFISSSVSIPTHSNFIASHSHSLSILNHESNGWYGWPCGGTSEYPSQSP